MFLGYWHHAKSKIGARKFLWGTDSFFIDFLFNDNIYRFIKK